MSVTYTKKIDVDSAVVTALDEDIRTGILPSLETAVKQNTPVLTGRLKASIEARKLGVLEGEVKTNVEYSQFVEFGTTKMSPRAMFRKGANAVEQLGDKLLRNIKNLV
jgi:HK97 gp10 family phage protein